MQRSETPRATDMEWDALREKTLAAHEVPALFEEIEVDDSGDQLEEFTNADGIPVGAYATELALWEMKTGRYTPAPNAKRSLWSRIKHGVIANAMDHLGYPEIDHRPGVMLHPRLDAMSSRLDALASRDGHTYEPVIAFNVPSTKVSTWRGSDGDWQPPFHVLLQAQHHMAVRRCEAVHVVALVGGVDPRTFLIEADPEMIEDIEAAVVDFFEAVASDTQPRPDPDRDLRVLQRLAPPKEDEGAEADLSEDRAFLDLINERNALTKQRSDLEKDIKRISAQITERMSGFERARISDTQEVAWVRKKGGPVSYIAKPSVHFVVRKIPQARKDKAASAS